MSDEQKEVLLRTVIMLAILALANSLIACGEGKSEVAEVVEQESIAEKGLIDAEPGIPNLEGAAFDVDKKDSFVESENGLEIRLVEKIGDSYKISIGWSKNQ